jgi:hypothetical protein
MAHVITFTTSRFDVTKETPNPNNPIAGHSALTWLRAELEKVQYRTTEPDAEDWGWYIDVHGPDAAYMVGASADAEGPSGGDVEWTIQVHKHRSAKDKILGRNKMAADDPLAELIERIVRADPQMTEIMIEREP